MWHRCRHSVLLHLRSFSTLSSQWQLCVPNIHSLDRCDGNSEELNGKSRNSPAEDIEKDENLRYRRPSGFLMVVFLKIIITRKVFKANNLLLTYFLTGFSSLCAAWNWDYNGAISTEREHNWNCLHSTKPVLRKAKHVKIKHKLSSHDNFFLKKIDFTHDSCELWSHLLCFSLSKFSRHWVWNTAINIK